MSIVVWRQGPAYLVLHRSHHGPDFAGDWAWTNPAGARLPGEDPLAAARRELLEEAGLELDIRPVRDGEVALFVAEAPGDAEVRLDAEHDAFAWVDLAEARRRCLPAMVGESFAAVDKLLRQ